MPDDTDTDTDSDSDTAAATDTDTDDRENTEPSKDVPDPEDVELNLGPTWEEVEKSPEKYAYGEDDQDYVDRDAIDFDPKDNLYTGTTVDGTSEIPDPGESDSDQTDSDSDSGETDSDKTDSDSDE